MLRIRMHVVYTRAQDPSTLRSFALRALFSQYTAMRPNCMIYEVILCAYFILFVLSSTNRTPLTGHVLDKTRRKTRHAHDAAAAHVSRHRRTAMHARF